MELNHSSWVESLFSPKGLSQYTYTCHLYRHPLGKRLKRMVRDIEKERKGHRAERLTDVVTTKGM